MMRWFLIFGLALALPLAAQDPGGSPPADPPESPPPAPVDRALIDVELEASAGGGRARVSAGDFDYSPGDYLIATGGVRLEHRDLILQADTARLDIATNELTAEGTVVLDEGPRRIIGDTLEYNLETRTGRITNATAYVDSTYTFTGKEIAKVDDMTYTLEEGVFTSCSEEVPPWSIKMGKARVTLDNYARIKNARMRFKNVPALWVPYMVWPTKTDRSSGLLIPQPGFSDRRGAELSLAYYQTLGRSADTTFFFDLSTEDYFGFGNEIRYRPSENTRGSFEAYILNDPEIGDIEDALAIDPNFPIGIDPDLLPDQTRWKVNWFHEANDFWGGFRGVINFQDFSDPAFRQDFERSVNRQTNTFIYSSAYLTRNFGNQSFNIMVDQRERVRLAANPEQRIRGGEVTDTLRQLPEIEYRLRPTRLGNLPIYFSLDTNFHYLSRERVLGRGASRVVDESEYSRADILPFFSLPLSTIPWLSFKLDLGARSTFYSNSLDSNGRFLADEESLTRSFAVAGAELVGPSFSKIFESQNPNSRFSKLKHIVEPRFEYNFRGDFEEQDEVPLFDEIDNVRPTNGLEFSFINRILAKPRDEEQGGAFEIASFEISQRFSFDDDQFLQRGTSEGGLFERKKEGPIVAVFRYNPTPATSLKTEARYNTLFGQMQSASLSGGARLGPHNFGGSLFTNWGPNEGADISRNQVRFFTTLALVPNKLTLDAAVNFDIEESELLQQRYFIDYEGSCYSLRFELRESKFGDLTDRDFRFSFNLKNVGTFIDLNGSAN